MIGPVGVIYGNYNYIHGGVVNYFMNYLLK